MKWVIEDGIFSEQEKIEQALSKLGYNYTLCKTDFLKRGFENCFLFDSNVNFADDTTFFYGSIVACRYVYKNTRWQVWVPDDVFDFHYYATRVSGLLNDDYILCPFGHVKEKGKLFGDVFVKPNSGYKPFTGFACKSGDLEKELQIVRERENIFPEELCVVASKKEVINEYRILVVDNEVICGTQYLPTVKSCPEYILDYARTVIKNSDYYPCLAWTLDIAESPASRSSWYDEEFSVLEVNSFSAAGLYDIDIELALKTITTKALYETL